MKTWTVRMCTLKDLCGLYGVSYKIIKKQLSPYEEEIGEKHGNFFSVIQVIKIFKFLGEPSGIIIIYPNGHREIGS